MKILIVHNQYQQAGGEDVVVKQESAILRQAGHQVVEYFRSNDEIKALGLIGKFSFLKRLIWASDAVRELRALIHKENPDVAHFHNTFLMISPSAYYACQELKVPVVQTLHNYRLLCPRADFFIDGHICEACTGKIVPWPGVLRGCYHDLRSHTAAVSGMLLIHRWLKTWTKQVDVFIALTEFARQKFIQGSLPEDKIVVKPNFAFPDPGIGEKKDDYIIFVGRLSPEKKISTLFAAMKKLSRIHLKVVGTGPKIDELNAFVKAQKLNHVKMLGYQPHDKVFTLVKEARFLVFPSEWYEGFPMTIIESFACGIPVISSRLGAMASIIDDGRTGLHFTAGDADDLASKIDWAWTHEKEMQEMGKAARKEYEDKYTAEINLKQLLDIYQIAISKKNTGL